MSVTLRSDGDLYGDAVNVAARIQEAAEPGQVVLSRDVWQQLRKSPRFPVPVAGRSVLERHRSDDSIFSNPTGERGEADAT
jgi:adenylate cyclase